jgi:hypothetical protein
MQWFDDNLEEPARMVPFRDVGDLLSVVSKRGFLDLRPISASSTSAA